MNIDREDKGWETLSRDVRETLRAYLKEMMPLFGTGLEAVVLYGSAARGDFQQGRSNLNLLLLSAGHDLDVLSRFAKMHRRWRKEGIVVPLLLTAEELQRSAELFSLEYLDLCRHYIVIHGKDPFVRIAPDRGRLSVQCLQEIGRNLVRVRQRFVEGGGTPEAIAVLMPLSITGLLPALRALADLMEYPGASSADHFLEELGERLSMDSSPLADAWRLKTGLISPGKLELPRLFERYVSSLASLAEHASKALADRPAS